MRPLAGKRVAVTGASRGLGRAFALALAAAGADLVVNARDPHALERTAEEVKSLGSQCVRIAGSVADDDVCASIVGACVETYGGIDAMVANAGLVRDRTLLKMTPEEFDEVVAVHLRGTFSCGRHAALAMKDTGGVLLHVIAALDAQIGQSNYGAAKSGIISLTRSWSRELARYGIRVNALWPVAATEMSSVMIDRLSADRDPRPDPRELGFGPPEEVAPAAVYLVSDAAAHLSGHLVFFNGRQLATFAAFEPRWSATAEKWDFEDIAAALAAGSEAL